MKRIFAIAVLLIGVCIQTNAQSMGRTYKTALGVKVWDGAGITFKSFIAPNRAVELIAHLWNQGTRFTGLYEIYGDIEGAPALKWYVGPGAHLGLYDKDRYAGSRAVIGVDGVLGLDYKINKAPLNVSLDWQPSFEFADERGFSGSWRGLGVRYTF